MLVVPSVGSFWTQFFQVGDLSAQKSEFAEEALKMQFQNVFDRG